MADLTEDQAYAVEDATDQFREFAHSRMRAGAEQYGPYGFLSRDTPTDILEEVADLYNYTLMLGCKLVLVRAKIREFEAFAKVNQFAPTTGLSVEDMEKSEEERPW
jgi:hypothetical protein